MAKKSIKVQAPAMTKIKVTDLYATYIDAADWFSNITKIPVKSVTKWFYDLQANPDNQPEINVSALAFKKLSSDPKPLIEWTTVLVSTDTEFLPVPNLTDIDGYKYNYTAPAPTYTSETMICTPKNVEVADKDAVYIKAELKSDMPVELSKIIGTPPNSELVDNAPADDNNFSKFIKDTPADDVPVVVSDVPVAAPLKKIPVRIMSINVKNSDIPNITAIKFWRLLTDSGLKEAKDFVESVVKSTFGIEVMLTQDQYNKLIIDKFNTFKWECTSPIEILNGIAKDYIDAGEFNKAKIILMALIKIKNVEGIN